MLAIGEGWDGGRPIVRCAQQSLTRVLNSLAQAVRVFFQLAAQQTESNND